jgi:hypothetical protein
LHHCCKQQLFSIQAKTAGIPLERGNVAYPWNVFMKDEYYQKAGL